MQAKSGSLEEFLFERYSLYVKHKNTAKMAYTLHEPWKFKEAKAKLRATEAIHSLMSLKPMSAFVVQDDGETKLASPIEDIDIGSLIIV